MADAAPAKKLPRKLARKAAAETGPAAAPMAGIGDEAVKAKTGKTWSEWLDVLDAGGARELKHSDIALLLHDKHGVPDWWAQTVTVGYEQARGLRQKHQKPEGYEVSGNKTVAVPLARLWEAWRDEALRRRWLPEPFEVRKATPERSLRITWPEPPSRVDVNFYAKGEAKSQVSLQHGHLADAEAGERMKAFWKQRLEALKAVVEGS